MKFEKEMFEHCNKRESSYAFNRKKKSLHTMSCSVVNVLLMTYYENAMHYKKLQKLLKTIQNGIEWIHVINNLILLYSTFWHILG